MRKISKKEADRLFPCPPEYIKKLVSRKGKVQYCLESPRFGRYDFWPTPEEALADWSCYAHPDLTYNDYKEMPDERLEEIDQQAKKNGMEVVRVHFSGDSVVWYLDSITNPKHA